MGISSLILTLLITVYGIIHAGQIKTTEMDIQMAGLKKDVKIVHLSDLHIGHFRGVKWMQKIADITKAQQPDIVCITGDLFDGKIRLNKNVIAPLKQLEAPIYFVEGNHDGYTDIKKIKQNLKKEGIRVLSNQIANTHGLQIVGLNHMLADEDAVDIHAKHKTMKEVLEIMPIYPEMPTILLHHSPDGIEYANKAGVNLFLAGHTHAGQLFPINCIANMIFAYNRGLHQYKDTQIYVSEGIGTFGPPMRIGTRSEIVVLNLKKDDKVTSTSHY